MAYRYYLICGLLLLSFNQCASVQSQTRARFCPRWTPTNLVYASKSSADKSLRAANPKEKVQHSAKGIDWANKCVAAFPKEAGCYYYRAVNTGLYIQTASIGYQKKLKKMIADLNKTISLQSSYDQGGAYRILGEIYLETPAFSLSHKGITQDLDKALDYAKKAMSVNDHDVENLRLYAFVLAELEEWPQAVPLLSQLSTIYAQGRSLDWQEKKNNKKIMTLLKRGQKELTK